MGCQGLLHEGRRARSQGQARGSDPTDQSAILQYPRGARLVTVTGSIEKPSDVVRWQSQGLSKQAGRGQEEMTEHRPSSTQFNLNAPQNKQILKDRQ